MSSEEDVRTVKRRHSAQLLSKPGVTGVGVEQDERGDFVLVIHVADENALVALGLPDRLDDVPVRPIITGQYRKQSHVSRAEEPKRPAGRSGGRRSDPAREAESHERPPKKRGRDDPT
jgi:hypothetical protein